MPQPNFCSQGDYKNVVWGGLISKYVCSVIYWYGEYWGRSRFMGEIIIHFRHIKFRIPFSYPRGDDLVRKFMGEIGAENINLGSISSNLFLSFYILIFPPPTQALCSTGYFSIGNLIHFLEYPASWLPDFLSARSNPFYRWRICSSSWFGLEGRDVSKNAWTISSWKWDKNI